MNKLSLEHVVLIALIERLLQNGLLFKNDIIAMRETSMGLIETWAEAPDSSIVNAARKTATEVDRFYEGYLRMLR
jgi:hypothetical protein